MTQPSRTISVDTETALMLPGLRAPPLACLSYAERKGSEIERGLIPREHATSWFRDRLKNPDIRLVGHHFAYDTTVLSNEDPSLLPLLFAKYRAGHIHDTMHRAQLRDLSRGMLGYRQKGFYTLNNLTGGKMDKSTWRLGYGKLIQVPFEQWPEGAREYALTDAAETLSLWEHQGDVPDTEAQARAGFVFQLMSTWGMRADPVRTHQVEEKLKAEYMVLKAKLTEAGIMRENGTQNIALTRELIEKSYPAADVPRTRTGAIQTSEEVVDACTDPALEGLGRYKHVQKLLSTYIPALKRAVDGPLCPRINTILKNGRTSYSDPNLQNLPRKDPVRECFVPRDGNVFVDCDYDTLEVRTFAQVLKDLGHGVTLANAYGSDPDFDPHCRLAAQIMSIPYEEAIKRKNTGDGELADIRQMAKCFHPDVEVLSRNGWVKISELSGKEEIAVACPEIGGVSLKWEKPIRLTKRPSPGHLVHLKNEGIDLRVTEDHRMLGFRQDGSPFECQPANLGNARYWANTGKMPGGGLVIAENLLRLAVATQADGSYHGNQIIFGFTKTRKIERMRKLLRETPGVDFEERTVGVLGVPTFVLKGKVAFQVRELLDEKRFPLRWLSLSEGCREVVLDEIRYWDAKYTQEGAYTVYYVTTVEQNLDVLQAIATLAGRKTRVRLEEGCFVLSIKRKTRTRGGNLQVEKIPYSGEVFCLTTSTNCVLVRDGATKIPVVTKQCGVFGFAGGMGHTTMVVYAWKSFGVRLNEAKSKWLKQEWRKSLPEVSKYFNMCQLMTKNGKASFAQLRSGRIRGGCQFTDLANGYWSGLAADGAKWAGFNIAEACYAKPHSPLYGTRPVVYIHDEYMLEAPKEQGHEAAQELSRIMQSSMEDYTPDVPSRASACLMNRWIKGAKPVYENGRLVPYEPALKEAA